MNSAFLLIRRACAIALGVIALVCFVDVIGRYLLARTLPGGYDLALRLQAFAILWGIALASRERAHICVDALYERLDVAAARVVQRFADAFTVLFFLAAGCAALQQVAKVYASQERLAGIDIPAWPFFLAASCGLVLAAPCSWYTQSKADPT